MKKDNFTAFEKELEILIEKYSIEKQVGSNTAELMKHISRSITELQDANYMRDTNGLIPDIDFKRIV